MAGFLAGDEGIAVLQNGVDHIGDLAGVGLAVNHGGRGALGAFHDLGAGRGILIHLPFLDHVVFDHDAALAAVHVQTGAETGIGGGVALQQAQGAGLELQRGHGHVLHLDALMGQCGALRLDFLHGAAEVLDHVHIVHALVHQRAAAVQGPGAAPIAGIVVLLGAVPLGVAAAEADLAQGALFDGLLQVIDVRIRKRCWERQEKLDVALAAGLDQPVRRLQGNVDGLFHDHVFAGLGGLAAKFGVHAAGQAPRG